MRKGRTRENRERGRKSKCARAGSFAVFEMESLRRYCLKSREAMGKVSRKGLFMASWRKYRGAMVLCLREMMQLLVFRSRGELYSRGQRLKPATTCFSYVCVTVSNNYGWMHKISFYSIYFMADILNTEFAKLNENLVL